jgi:hypothetical protein
MLIAAVLGGCMAARPTLADATAADGLPLGSAVGWVPADAAVCGAVLRSREQVEAAAASRAWNRLAGMPVWEQFAEVWRLPAVQLAREILYAHLTEPGTTGAQLEMLVNDPQLQRLAALGADMLSEEVVWYADAQAVDFLRVLGQLPEAAELEVLLQTDDGSPDLHEARRAAAKRLAESLAERADQIELPGIVWAFRVSDRQRAAEQLGKLELVASVICWSRPELRGRLRRFSMADNSYITLTLDGRLVAPWMRGQLAALDVAPDKIAQMIAELERLPLVVALGMRRNYVVLAVGPSLDVLQKIHGDDARLVDRPEMAPLREALKQRLTGLSYLSPPLVAGLHGAIAQPADAAPHEPGAVLAYSLWTDRGIELFTFDWTAGPGWAEVEPLSLLAHAGERPLALVAWRTRVSEERYNAWIHRIATGGERLDAWLRPRLGTQSLKTYRIGLALWKPFGRRGEMALREMVFPLIEQGQAMFVLDVRRSDTGQLAVRPAVVLDISRAESLWAAYAEFAQVVAEIRDAMVGVDSLPPDALKADDDGGNGLPAAGHRGFPTQFPLQPHVYCRGNADPDALAPALGLSGHVAVAALSAGRAGELLEPHSPQLVGLLAEPRERLSAAYLDWSGLVELARPAAHRGAQSLATARARTEENADDLAEWDMLHSQIDTLFDLLQVVRSLSCQQYLSDGALVTHRLIEIRDVE